MNDIIRADDADAGRLSQVIADAFIDLPPSRWLIADRAARRDVFPGYFLMFVEHALATGVVHTTPDRSAVAVWQFVGDGHEAGPADYDERLAALTGPWTDRFVAFDAALDRCHPVGTPHHYLAMIAVRPDRQGAGIGAELLRSYHQAIDQQEGGLAYLEASSERVRSLYLRHGYASRPDSPFYLPDGGPPMWPMLRRGKAGGLDPVHPAGKTTCR
jgi:GNAT superfamily N-acetyltransferase